VTASGASDGFVWIVPIRPDARVDVTTDAWLDALDEATSPVVLPPLDGCSSGAPDFVPHGATPVSSLPTTLQVFADATALNAYVSSAGYAIPSSLEGAIEASLAAGGAFVASTYPLASLPTRTLRVVEASAPVLPLALTSPLSTGAPVSVFVIASEGASAGASPLTLDPAVVLWDSTGLSTYPAERDALLAQAEGARWLTESTSPDVMFTGAAIGSETTEPSVLARYSALAATYGDAGPCIAGDAGSDDATGEDGATAGHVLSCARPYDDDTVALGELAEGSVVWVSRLSGAVTPASASDVPIAVAPVAASGPALVAGGSTSTSTCDAPSPPAAATAAPASTVPAPRSPGYSYPEAPQSPSSADPGAASTAAAEGCGAVADSCSTDSSQDDSDGGGGGCGSSDSSGSDGGGGGCGSSDASGDDCSTARRGHARSRSPVSRVLLALAGTVAALRRRGRCRPVAPTRT
jgi:hypothetical protein